MLIVIDLAASTVSLRGPDEFTSFSVALEGDGDLARVVHQSGLGRLAADGEHVVVDPGAVRALAGPAAGEGWDEGFDGDVRVRRRKGLGGGRWRHPGPHRATRWAGLRSSRRASRRGRDCPLPTGRRYPLGYRPVSPAAGAPAL